MSENRYRAENPVRRNNGHSPRLDDLSTLVRARRKTLGLTQQEFADMIEISVGTLRDLEQERTRRPVAKSILRLASVLGGDSPLAPGRYQRLPAAAGVSERAANGRGRACMALQVLGPLMAWRNGTRLRLGGPKQRAVLGLLAVTSNFPVSRDALIDAIWDDNPPRTVVSILQQYISRLRHVLDRGRDPRDPRGILVSGGSSYRLQVRDDELDLLRFEHLADRARAASLAGDTVAACELYERALRLWRDEPLADSGVLRDHPSVIAVRQAGTAAVTEFAQNGFTLGLHDRVLPHLRRLATRDPLNERAHAQLMLALAHVGQQAAALQQFEEIRHRLDVQLGVLPGTELASVHMQVLRQEIPAAGTLSGRAGCAANPGYTGTGAGYAGTGQCCPRNRAHCPWAAATPTSARVGACSASRQS
jgi:DNA-binding SARP family transcriptional activator/DNA-binding XRE family transcriptional regulator